MAAPQVLYIVQTNNVAYDSVFKDENADLTVQSMDHLMPTVGTILAKASQTFADMPTLPPQL